MYTNKIFAATLLGFLISSAYAAETVKTPVFSNLQHDSAQDVKEFSSTPPALSAKNIAHVGAVSSEVLPESDYQIYDRIKVTVKRSTFDPQKRFNKATITGKITNLWYPSGMARSINALTAIRQVLPPHWTVVDKTDGRLESTTVAWDSSPAKNWLQHLNNFALKSGTTIAMDFNSRTLTASLYGFSEKDQPTFQTVRDDARQKKIQLEQESTRAYLKDVWILKPGKTLKENLVDWVAAAGWSGLAYEADDFPISYEVRLTGSWTAENGPIAQLATIYGETAMPLIFTLKTGNKVLLVTPAKPSLYSVDTVPDAQRRDEMTAEAPAPKSK